MPEKEVTTLFPNSKKLFYLLGMKGSIEFLDFLHKDPHRHTDMKEDFDYSASTFGRRLHAFQNLGIVRSSQIEYEGKPAFGYTLTDYGSKLMDFINSYEKKITS
jgi:DNA-binding HxlR family transcriptional regulator